MPAALLMLLVLAGAAARLGIIPLTSLLGQLLSQLLVTAGAACLTSRRRRPCQNEGTPPPDRAVPTCLPALTYPDLSGGTTDSRALPSGPVVGRDSLSRRAGGSR